MLDAANRLFATSGPADVSLRAIARAAGVNHGLVHRHFGTRDALVDRLLERIAAEWTAEVQASGDFDGAIDSILGSPAEALESASTWLRLLAWSLLTDPPGRSGEAQRRYATLDLLPGMLEDREPGDATVTTAAALALVFGWRFFHPYIRAALHLEGESFETLHEAIRQSLRSLADPPRPGPAPAGGGGREREPMR